MYHNLKKISAIAITITAIVTVPSCGFDSDQPSEVATTNSPEESVVSDDPSLETPEPPTQEKALTECGLQIDWKAGVSLYGGGWRLKQEILLCYQVSHVGNDYLWLKNVNMLRRFVIG